MQVRRAALRFVFADGGYARCRHWLNCAARGIEVRLRTGCSPSTIADLLDARGRTVADEFLAVEGTKFFIRNLVLTITDVEAFMSGGPWILRRRWPPDPPYMTYRPVLAEATPGNLGKG